MSQGVSQVAPIYDATSIVNAADNQSGALAPNTLGTIYGANLAQYIDYELGTVERLTRADSTPPNMVPFWSEFL